MNRQEAIKALLRAGKAKEMTQVIDEAVAAANRAYKAERDNRDLSDEAKRRYIAGEYVRHDRDLTDRLVRMASAVVSTDRGDAAKVFGIGGLRGDVANLTILQRDAADRVAAVTEHDQLRDLLARATRSGDEVLARAIAEKAVAQRDAKILNQFLEDRPHLRDAGERLWQAETAEDDSFGVTMRLVGLRPEEVGGMSVASAQALAES